MKTVCRPWPQLLRPAAIALLIALVGGFAQMALAQPVPGGPGGPGGHMGPHMRGGHGPMMLGGPMLERALDHAGASAEQRARVHDILKAARADVQRQHEQGRGSRQQLMALLATPVIDARAAETLRQQMLEQHDQASRRMMQALLDAAAVLSPQQRQKLAERMRQRSDMGERHRRERQALEPAPQR